MTRMAPNDDREELDQPRSIFSAMWFRAVLVVVVLGVIALLAVPHVLDMVNAPPSRQSASVKLAPTPSVAPVQPSQAPPAAERPTPPPMAQPTIPQPAEMAKAEPSAPSPPKPAEEPAAVKPPKAGGGPSEAGSQAPEKTSRGTYWVQVGAFRDAATAQRLAERLRADNYSVAESVKRSGPAPRAAAPAAPAGEGDRYNVFVSGLAPTELTAKLGAKGLNADVVAGGAVIKPSLSLREAVALSRDLSADGLQVQVRRAGRSDGGATAAASPAGSDASYHRVRVGSFPDKAAAMAVAKELEAKGYKPFVARGAK
jgi:cell division septation protein DedD